MIFLYFVRILLELHKLKKHRHIIMSAALQQNDDTVSINERDKPVDTTSEERAAKSLAIVYFIHFLASTLSFVLAYVLIILNYLHTAT